MVSELADIMNHCQAQAKDRRAQRLDADCFADKDFFAAAEAVYQEIASMCKQALIDGGYLPAEDTEGT